MEKLITSEHLSNIKFAADCAIKEPDSIYSQEFFMLIDETFGSKGDYESPTQAVAVAWLINRVNELEQRAEAAEAKLAELANQKPVAYVMGEETIDDFNSGYEFFAVRDAEHEEEMEIIPLFIRPAPAADLAELVPDKMTADGVISMHDCGVVEGWNDCCNAILRKIEEAK